MVTPNVHSQPRLSCQSLLLPANTFPHQAYSFYFSALCLPRKCKIGHAGQRGRMVRPQRPLHSFHTASFHHFTSGPSSVGTKRQPDCQSARLTRKLFAASSISPAFVIDPYLSLVADLDHGKGAPKAKISMFFASPLT